MSKRENFVVCVSNDGYAVSLEPRKIYRVLPDRRASGLGLLRVVDESGEDYLYPAHLFAPVDLPAATRRAILQA